VRLLKKKLMRKIKAVFIDRDGTINVEKKYVYKIEDFEFIPGALEALKLLTDNGIKIYVLTNQAGIAKGYFTEEHFQALTKHMINACEGENISIEDVLYCPHHPDGIVPEYTRHCLCRKPNTRLMEQVIREHGYNNDELVLIGDKKSDIDAGIKLRIDTYLVLTGYGKENRSSANATHVMPDILSVAKHIICDP